MWWCLDASWLPEFVFCWCYVAVGPPLADLICMSVDMLLITFSLFVYCFIVFTCPIDCRICP